MLANNTQYAIVNESQKLCITYLLESDSGKYSCRVENRIGKLEAYQQITIKGNLLNYKIPKNQWLFKYMFPLLIILYYYYRKRAP